MSFSVLVSPQVYDLLAKQAKQSQQTPDALAEDILRSSLTADLEQWRREFESLIKRVQSKTAQFGSAEIEADITVAAEEVRELRRARRRAN